MAWCPRGWACSGLVSALLTLLSTDSCAWERGTCRTCLVSAGPESGGTLGSMRLERPLQARLTRVREPHPRNASPCWVLRSGRRGPLGGPGRCWCSKVPVVQGTVPGATSETGRPGPPASVSQTQGCGPERRATPEARACPSSTPLPTHQGRDSVPEVAAMSVARQDVEAPEGSGDGPPAAPAGGVTPGSCLEELCVFRKTRGGCGLGQGNFVIFPCVTLEASECHTHLICGAPGAKGALSITLHAACPDPPRGHLGVL